ncbi:uncharacterized protein LOC121378352 [Gigantopelta aegis]|uniref:uncharacterized protein LOC121378352 n=1 Tax=Gigantopelta aegis TaxID=1735272 RepID=UPI001B88D640|nr:uncharacterized protein LOC121378352 [Gigantopelta aegis]
MPVCQDGEEDISTMVRSLSEYLELDKRASAAKDYALDHPVITVFWIVTTAMCGIPIICFFTFVFATILFSVAGFVLIEGTIVTIAALLLGAALLIAGLLSLGFSLTIVMAFLAIQYSQKLLEQVNSRVKSHKQLATSE